MKPKQQRQQRQQMPVFIRIWAKRETWYLLLWVALLDFVGMASPVLLLLLSPVWITHILTLYAAIHKETKKMVSEFETLV